LAELISDSESELAFVLGHELGHIIQARISQSIFSTNIELDADQQGVVIALESGYDPYGAAGALGKLSMVSSDASVIDQNFDNLAPAGGVDLRSSFNNWLAVFLQNMRTLCAADTQNFCSQYKSISHPHLPPHAPLVNQPGAVSD
jgi:predicted Zn-dependent protease